MLKELIEGNGLGFRAKVRERLEQIREDKLNEVKKLVAARYYSEELSEKIDDQEEDLEVEQLEVLKQGDDDLAKTIEYHHGLKTDKTYKGDASNVKDSEAKRASIIARRREAELKKKVNEDDVVSEANVTRQGRLKVVKIRIRQGKVQRRRKVSAVKGFTLRGGRVIRMKPSERRRRRMGARRAKFKRKGKLARIRIKTKRSMRRRHAMGL